MSAVISPPATYNQSLPTLCGWESSIQEIGQSDQPVFLERSNLDLQDLSAGFAIALHMHQPTIPAGPEGQLIGHLQYMFEHHYEGDNHNAGPFAYCYARMGDFIPELIDQGCNPRIMLDYSGNLLWGLQQMGRNDIIDKLKGITCDPRYQPYVEWLGTFWGHAVAAATPLPDIKLHIQAWQHQFVSIFGLEALKRVRGFSLPEMQLPNHPDALYTLVSALKESGYRWVMVQEHTIETLAGEGIRQPHVPHRLIARNSHGEEISITVLIKTQGSDTKLIGQMQPFYEAKTLDQVTIGNQSIPPLVSQISDGENGGVMMNEFPGAFKRAWHESQHERNITGINGTEYLELLGAAGITESDFPSCQAIGQHHLWQALESDDITPEKVHSAISTLSENHITFSGGSWTNERSWIDGYDNVVGPMERLSARLHQATEQVPAAQRPHLVMNANYRQALLYNLILQTSCFRYWGQGQWTDYARTLYQRGCEFIERGFA
ncbi:polysaccharide deacetylase family protein [Leptothoe spongobia]|uniref:Glycosyl hydrolase family 57 n=1 Tax=Leptothoe spongobia TAU-MAC 1115 TaxID=1967444 RepID=A0A947GQE1_9CYAN|nr:glycosyl hydrolase family 57 [Leptothoe spongobia]MBT9317006.1 glycosyl hydrolase family 57 [Leptothoe spongobia TAU-MAC 1115]